MNISRRQLLRGRVSLDDLSISRLKNTPAKKDNTSETVIQQLEISNECLAFNQVSCRSCQDICEAQAIRFQLQIGKPAIPTIDYDQCNSCGECISICPSKAMSLIDKKVEMNAAVKEVSEIKGAQA